MKAVTDVNVIPTDLALRGAFWGRSPPKYHLRSSKREMRPASKGCASKESNSPGATGVHFGACAPPKKTACAPQT